MLCIITVRFRCETLYANYERLEFSLQLNNNISDGFGGKRTFELFLRGRVIGLKEFSDLAGNSDDKREGHFEEEENGGYLCKGIGS